MNHLVFKSTLFVLMLFNILVEAQSLNSSTNQIIFGTVNELSVDSQLVVLSNTSNNTVNIKASFFFKTYDQYAFSIYSLPNAVAPLSSVSFYVRFHPQHNIAHNSELIIACNGGKGYVRIDLKGQGAYSKTYYNTTVNLEEQALKTALKSIISANYNSLIYGPARDSMFMKYDNESYNGQGATQNTIECVYTGRKAIGYVDRTDCQTNFSFNTEHTFPQGFFDFDGVGGGDEPMRSDLYHLFPTDDNANNVRGSFPFGMVSSPTWTDGGSKFGNNIFEPRDAQKGRTARAMMYFVVRYDDYSGFMGLQQGILKVWNKQFLPNLVEQQRCNAINASQGNRNPFIDYPQFADRITDFSGTSASFDMSHIFPSADTIDFGTVDVTAINPYSFWIVNDGNRPISISNINVNPSAVLYFANGTNANTIIQPGEASRIDLELVNAPPGLLTGYLNFSAQGPGLLANVTVPIVANLVFVGLNDEYKKPTTIVTPNPASTEFCLINNTSNTSNILRDVVGNKIAEFNDNCYQIPTTIKSGMYLLEIMNKNVVEQRHKIVIVN